MTRTLAAALALSLIAGCAEAALKPGAKAPAFNAPASQAGKPLTVNLNTALRKGPVVLYFFPKAFTGGCDLQAKMFSESIGDFRAQGASVIGVSRDDLPALHRFSVEKCANAFPVVSDRDGRITKAYDAVLPVKREYANRTSYVIARTGRVAYEYTALNPEKHVDNTLAAVKALNTPKKG